MVKIILFVTLTVNSIPWSRSNDLMNGGQQQHQEAIFQNINVVMKQEPNPFTHFWFSTHEPEALFFTKEDYKAWSTFF